MARCSKRDSAQPSGITSDGKVLYTADSEANVIREIDPGTGQVRTLAGANLFEFGDQDGYRQTRSVCSIRWEFFGSAIRF